MRIELIAHVWLIERKKHLRISGRKFSVMIFNDGKDDGTDNEDKNVTQEPKKQWEACLGIKDCCAGPKKRTRETAPLLTGTERNRGK